MQVVITGTSRGIGLELVRTALGHGHQVVAVARHSDGSQGLQQLLAEHPARLRLVAVDLRQPDAAQSIAAALEWNSLDVLVNNAGVLLEGTSREDFIDSFLVNSIAPFEVTRALLPLLERASSPRVLQLTSRMGSLGDNTSGGYYAYRASKAALNMITRSLARDHDWLAAAVVHPGWVQTAMGGEGAPVPAATSAAGIWRLAEGLDRRSSGRFFDYQGNELPW